MMISEKAGTVFSASTTDWTLGLSQDDACWTAIDQITLNVFRRLGGLGPACDVVGFDANGGVQLDRTNIGWRSTWDVMVPGAFTRTDRDQIVLYDRAGGVADIVGFDAGGNVNLDTSNTGWRSSWDWMVSGHFFGNDTSEVWLCDRSGNFAEIVAFDAGGHFGSAWTFDAFGPNRGGAVAGDFLGMNREQIMRYSDQSGIDGDVIGIQIGNQHALDVVAGDWSQPWDLLLAGRFKGTARTEFLLYTASLGAADMFGLDENGNISRQQAIDGWRSSWVMGVAGRFLGNGRDQIALYDRGSI